MYRLYQEKSTLKQIFGNKRENILETVLDFRCNIQLQSFVIHFKYFIL